MTVIPMIAEASTTDLVRQYAAQFSIIRKKQVRDALNLSPEQTASAFDTLIKQGCLRKNSPGVYQFVDQTSPAREGRINDRIWRGMQMAPVWSGSEIARLAGTTTNYMYKIMRRYRAEGLIAPAGRQAALSGASEKLWRLTPKGRALKNRPAVKPFQVNPVVAAVVDLNRLVCTGLAERNPDKRQLALMNCTKIAAYLAALEGEEANDEYQCDSPECA